MTDPVPPQALGTGDYPLSEKRPDLVRTATGKPLDSLTLDAIAAGAVGLADLAITPQALTMQAAIARAAGRETLARNFERAAELVGVPQDVILETYELLRPGRAKDKQTLLDAATRLRRDYGADRIAAFVEEAAAVYERRKLFTYRF
ncbi:diol dehydratase small subunit [Azospirillum halopraeferens]|uniref:diol dehydratase small subunit n=1 Tax=Azospirillum halopraeferens TaxID=34010 RepID=UPI0004251051|nr:diol dehydratase small subunit [Azospirillum halopraeferens]